MQIKCSRCRQRRPETDIHKLSGRPVCDKCAAESAARNYGRRPKYKPTPEQIAATCAEIRKDDTEKQLRKRAKMTTEPYTIPELHVSRSLAEWLAEGRVGRHGY